MPRYLITLLACLLIALNNSPSSAKNIDVLPEMFDEMISTQVLDIRPNQDAVVGAGSGTMDSSTAQDGEFRQIDLKLVPPDEHVAMPPDGGSFTYQLVARNSTNRCLQAELSMYIRLPGGSLFGPTSVVNMTIQPFMQLDYSGLTQIVPTSASAGVYELITYLRCDDTIIAEDNFTFLKHGSFNEYAYQLNEWINDPVQLQEASSSDSIELPSQYGLYATPSDPLNPLTEMTVTLPHTADLTVSIINTTGQHISTLASGTFPAGEHPLTFNARPLAGGVYFVHAEVPGKLDAVQKVVFLK